MEHKRFVPRWTRLLFQRFEAQIEKKIPVVIKGVFKGSSRKGYDSTLQVVLRSGFRKTYTTQRPSLLNARLLFGTIGETTCLLPFVYNGHEVPLQKNGRVVFKPEQFSSYQLRVGNPCCNARLIGTCVCAETSRQRRFHTGVLLQEGGLLAEPEKDPAFLSYL